MRALLLPGMDGTSDLFGPLSRALAPQLEPEVCAYPCDRALGYDALEAVVRARFDGSPRVVIAESFSGHLGIRLAADPPPGLRAVVLAAAFAAPPAPAVLASFAGTALFGLRPPASAVRAVLVGWDAPAALVDDVRAAIARVAPDVLAARLRAILREDSRGALASAKVPLLCIRPTRDRLVRRRRALRPPEGHAALVAIRAPHLVLQRAPERCAEAIRAFVASLG